MIRKLLTLGLFVAATATFSQLSGSTVSAAEPKSDDSYHYTAQAGDSYSQMARKAVQTYGIKTNTKLSPAQILFAENGLTNDAGNIELNLNQSVDVKKSAVGAWIDKAKKLSAAELAAWATYVPFVDFNTNNVGEKR